MRIGLRRWSDPVGLTSIRTRHRKRYQFAVGREVSDCRGRNARGRKERGTEELGVGEEDCRIEENGV